MLWLFSHSQICWHRGWSGLRPAYGKCVLKHLGRYAGPGGISNAVASWGIHRPL